VSALDETNNACLSNTCLVLDAESGEAISDVSCGLVLLQAKFRMLMEVAAIGDELVGKGGHSIVKGCDR